MRACLPLVATALLGCRDATSPRDEIALHRARWTAHAVTSYRYDYELTGFFIRYAGIPVRVQVRDGVVQAATDASTGQPLDAPLTQWPTVDQLFDDAARSASAGTLRAVRFDPTFDYPTEIDIDGPPDASGAMHASGLVPVR
ncbi:hypothetical protein J421_1356 [Gemmatirosa kalamazoonensis]|uniref:Lipoprotein n=1 Tax=Gemmatirosa kalamazoonensis TaxID=861299 RepID=W0RHL4_9BACT|nr:DUF6174 domain-containing protein [Gemmatirosa kalamazoonensis]AHG88893.1 hypothetical protein J421_1356 [Gemmatirosa kalamazoonensis]